MLAALKIVIKSAGEMGSAIAWRLFRSGFRNIVLLDTKAPVAVRRTVCFSEAIYDGEKTVDGVTGAVAQSLKEIENNFSREIISVVVDPTWQKLAEFKPDVVIDAIIAKKNLGTTIDEADLVIGLGPGFYAGKDVDLVIETNRGANCGRLIHTGEAEANTGVPGPVLGHTADRVIRAKIDGIFKATIKINDNITKNEPIALISQTKVLAPTSGHVRGLIRDNIFVKKGMKIGDIEPRDNIDNDKISDKGLSVAGATLEAILNKYNK